MDNPYLKMDNPYLKIQLDTSKPNNKDNIKLLAGYQSASKKERMTMNKDEAEAASDY